MRRMYRVCCVIPLIAGGLLLAACGDDDSTDVDAFVQRDSQVQQDAQTQQDAAGGATVSGSVGRITGTCPPHQDGMGTLCLSLRTTCNDSGTEVAAGTVASANMSFPTNTVDFSIDDVPDGTLQLLAFHDDDASGCTAPTTGDFSLVAGCVEVTVTGGQDVTGVTVTFDQKTP